MASSIKLHANLGEGFKDGLLTIILGNQNTVCIIEQSNNGIQIDIFSSPGLEP